MKKKNTRKITDEKKTEWIINCVAKANEWMNAMCHRFEWIWKCSHRIAFSLFPQAMLLLCFFSTYSNSRWLRFKKSKHWNFLTFTEKNPKKNRRRSEKRWAFFGNAMKLIRIFGYCCQNEFSTWIKMKWNEIQWNWLNSKYLRVDIWSELI